MAPDSQQTYLKKAIVTTLLTPDDPRQVDLYSDATPNGDGKPFLYEQVLDNDGKPIQWQWRANKYAEYLIANKLTIVKIGKRNGLRVIFPLVSKHKELRAYKYASLVQKYSKKYNVNESLIYGNHKNRKQFQSLCGKPCPGLWPDANCPQYRGGKDVFQKIKKRSGQPTTQEPLRSGIQYRYRHRLYPDTTGAIPGKGKRPKRQALYRHLGLQRRRRHVLKTFSSNREQAVVKINQLPANEVYQQLTNKHPQAGIATLSG